MPAKISRDFLALMRRRLIDELDGHTRALVARMQRRLPEAAGDPESIRRMMEQELGRTRSEMPRLRPKRSS